MAGRRQYGAIRKLPSGRWQARHRDRLTNRLVPAPHTFKTRADASRWLASMEVGEHSTTLQIVQSRVRLEQYATDWIEQRTLRPRTEELYRSQLRVHITPHLGDAIVSMLEPKHVREWYSNLAKGTLSQTSVAKIYRLLRSILNTAVEDRILAENPCRIRKGGVEWSLERPIPTIDQVESLAAGMPTKLAVSVWIAALAGLRKGEVLGLQRRHVDLERATIRVDQALQEIAGVGAVLVPPKTAAGNRVVAIPDRLVVALAEHLRLHVEDDQNALLFTNGAGKAVRSSVWRKAWLDAQTQAQLLDIRFHDLRHLAGTLAAQAGATLRETMGRLGHSTVGASLRYQHVARERDREISDAIARIV